MKNLLLFLIVVTLPLLVGGCGGKDVAEVKPVEEKVLEIKEEVKNKESIVETYPELGGVNWEELEISGGIFNGIEIAYHKGSPYTGKSYKLHPNGQKRSKATFKDGKQEGLVVEWYENGQKAGEINWKDGKQEGLAVGWHANGQKAGESNFKDGKPDGLYVEWHDNGQKKSECNFKNGKLISGKYWNRKGDPFDSFEEAEAE